MTVHENSTNISITQSVCVHFLPLNIPHLLDQFYFFFHIKCFFYCCLAMCNSWLSLNHAWNQLFWYACVLNHDRKHFSTFMSTIGNTQCVLCVVNKTKRRQQVPGLSVTPLISYQTVDQCERNDLRGNFSRKYVASLFFFFYPFAPVSFLPVPGFPFSLWLYPWTQSSTVRKWMWCFFSNPLQSLS